MPKLSIITINFNDKNGLEKTIQSIVSQTFSDLELVVIDGGSTDGSGQIIEKYEKEIAHWVSEKDSGIYNAQNKGIKAAKGEYCLFLNSGDCLAGNNVLEEVFAGKNSEDIIYGDMMVDWGNGKVTSEKMHKKISVYEMYIDTVWHPVAFIKRALFEKFGLYDESFKMVADYEFFFRTIIFHKVSVRHLPFTISIFGFNGLSSDPRNKQLEQEERKRVRTKYLTVAEMEGLEERLQTDIRNKKKWFNRVINKLRS